MGKKVSHSKKRLIEVLKGKRYNYPAPTADILADKIVRYIAEQYAKGADLGITGDENGIIELIDLFLKKNHNRG